MDALTQSSDEGRGITAISDGEVYNNLRPVDLRMRKLCMINSYNFASNSIMRTLGSETSQYQEEKKQICISLVAASENEEAQTAVAIQRGCKVVM